MENSDSSSVDGGNFTMPSASTAELLSKQNKSLQQENRDLKMELEAFKLRMRTMHQENRALRQASVNIQAKAEQEEEFISNTLMKEICILKFEKARLALNFQQEEECLTNDLSRKLEMLRHEKAQIEKTLEQEQEALVNKLMSKVNKLEADIASKQTCLDQLRREKVELENTLEQEQESLVNRLHKRMDKLESEKRMLQEKLHQVASAVTIPEDTNRADVVLNLTKHIQLLKNEVSALKGKLLTSEHENSEKMAQVVMDDKHVKEENFRLQKQLQMEVERREALCRRLSESESSMEMEEERQFNDMAHCGQHPRACSSPGIHLSRARPLSPGFSAGIREFPGGNARVSRCPYCGYAFYTINSPAEFRSGPSFPPPGSHAHGPAKSMPDDLFLKPSRPPPHH